MDSSDKGANSATNAEDLALAPQQPIQEKRHSRLCSRLWALVSQPPITIALITAIAGPVFLAIFTNYAKNREVDSLRITEQAKLQASILSQVIGLTNSANFDKEAEIIRAGAIASLVNENKDTFGLSLEKSEKEFKQLAESLRTISTRTLREQVTKKEVEIGDLNQKLQQDQKSISDKEARIKVIDANLYKLERDRTSNKTEIEKLSKEKSTAQDEIRELSLASDKAKKELSETAKALQVTQDQLRVKNETLDALTKENKLNKADIERYRASLSESDQTIDGLKVKLGAVSEVAAKGQAKIDELTESLRGAKQEAATFRTKFETLDKKVSDQDEALRRGNTTPASDTQKGQLGTSGSPSPVGPLQLEQSPKAPPQAPAAPGGR